MNDRTAPWLKAAFDALMHRGIGAVKIERLARAVGLSKGSFYHHFAGRSALLEAMRQAWSEQGSAAVIARVEGPGGGPEARLGRLLDEIFTASDLDMLEGAMREWGAVDAQTAAVLQRTDAARVAYVAGLLAETGLPAALAVQRAEVLYRVVIGDFSWRRAGGQPLPETAVRDLAALVLLPAARGEE